MPVTLRIDRRDWVTVFTVDRPEVRNALDPTTLDALTDALAAASRDPGTGAAVLTGAGPACFSAGMDLRSVRADGARAGAAVRRFHQAMGSPGRLPVVAAVRGMAVGGGFELMLMCDLAVGGRGCRFALPEVRRGLLVNRVTDDQQVVETALGLAAALADRPPAALRRVRHLMTVTAVQSAGVSTAAAAALGTSEQLAAEAAAGISGFTGRSSRS